MSPGGFKKTLVSKLADQLPLILPHDAATPTRLLEVAFLATGRNTSITDGWEQRYRTTNTDTFFDHFQALPTAEVESALQGMNAQILREAKDQGLLPEAGHVAFDLHVDADYTKRHDGCIGYKDLPGTKYGMAYLSADLVTQDPRFTLAFTTIRPATDREEALRNVVLSVLAWTDITLALLDRGFQAAYAFRLFTTLDKRFVIPMIGNARLDAAKAEAWRLKQRIPNTPYWWHVVPDYDIGPSKGEKARVNVVVFYEPDSEGNLEPFVFATNAGDITPDFAVMLAEHYRNRWGIETGYRVKNQLRLRTTSEHYPTRLFLQLFSIIAFNLWTMLRAVWKRSDWADDRSMRQGYLLRHFRDDLVTAFAA